MKKFVAKICINPQKGSGVTKGTIIQIVIEATDLADAKVKAKAFMKDCKTSKIDELVSHYAEQIHHNGGHICGSPKELPLGTTKTKVYILPRP